MTDVRQFVATPTVEELEQRIAELEASEQEAWDTAAKRSKRVLDLEDENERLRLEVENLETWRDVAGRRGQDNERLRAAILDVKAHWYADPDQATWGGTLPRLFEALAAQENDDGH